MDKTKTTDQEVGLLQGLSGVSPDSALVTYKDLLLALAIFIRAIGTNYLPNMFPSLLPSPDSIVFPSPPILSLLGLFPSSLVNDI